MPKETLTIYRSDWRSILRHVQSTYPVEACGLLGGRAGLVEEVIQVDNVAHSAYRFIMHPAQQVSGIFHLEALGMDLLAIYHSHPNGAAIPSLTDVEEWRFGDTLSLILGREASAWAGRAYRIDGSRFRPVHFAVLSERSGGSKDLSEASLEKKKR